MKPTQLLKFTVACALLSVLALGNTKGEEGAELRPELSPEVVKILKKNKMDKENLYYSFKSLDNDKDTHLSFNGETPFIPASLTKIFTAVYALKKLGADYQFKTELYWRGKKKGTTFKGDVILKGTGDPSLTMARLMDLAMDLRARGVKKVEGNFYYDDSDLPPILAISDFGNGDQTYNPGLSALNLEFNRITLYRSGSRSTRRASFIPMPPMRHITVAKNADAFPLGMKYRFNPDKGGEFWEVSEKELYNLYEDIPVRRPSRRTAETFRFLCELWGIELPPPRHGLLTKGAELLGKDHSQPLLRLLALTLEYSNNLYAEQILIKASGQKSIPEAANSMTTWLKKNVPACDVQLVNGSGLTSEHKVKSHCLVDFLAKFALSPVSNRGFMSLLSINGQSGWLKNRLRHPDTAFRIWAKTGSLDYVSNMAGVLFSKGGNRYAFSLSLTDTKNRLLIDEAIFEGKKTEEKGLSRKLTRKVNALKKVAPRWSVQAKNAADELLQHFIETL